jgi:hypothetical protein
MPRTVPMTDGSSRGSAPAPSRRGIKLAVAAVVGVSVAIAAVALLGGTGGGSHPPQSTQVLAAQSTVPPSPVTTTTSPDATTTSLSLGDSAADVGPATDPATEATIADATTAFIKAWLQPGTPAQRTQALEPLTTTQLLPQLSGLPADALPQATLSSVTVTSFDESSAVVDANLSDGLVAICQLVATAGGHWQVSAIDRSPGPPTSGATSTTGS